MRRRKILSSAMTYLIFTVVSVLVLLPILYTVMSSFKTNVEIFTHPENLWPEKFTLDNYEKAMNSEVFDAGRMLLNSIYYTGVSVFLSLFVTLTSAYAFARGSFPLKNTFYGMFSALLFIHLGGVGAYATFEILAFLHVPISLHGLLFVKIFGLNVASLFIARSYIESLPKELDEAARIDGCGKFGIFFRIILPLLKPLVATLALLAFQGSWNEYISTTMYTQSHPEQRTLIVGIVALKNSGEGAASMNLMLAGTVISLIPVLFVYVLCNKYFVSGLTAGAVKG